MAYGDNPGSKKAPKAQKPVATGSRSDEQSGATVKPNRRLKKLAAELPAPRPAMSKPVSTKLVTVGHVKHVHQAKIARNRQLKKAQAQHDVPTNKDLSTAAAFNAANPVKHKQRASDIYLSDPAALKAAGFKPDKADALVQAPLRIPATLVRAAGATARTIKEKPSTAAHLPVELGQSLLSIPAGVIRSGLHPVKAAEAIAHDYSRRYGDLYNNKPGASRKMTERQKKEGIAPEVLDEATALTAGAGSVGKGAQLLADAGKLGKAAERVASAERPALQVSGAAVAQKAKGKNFFSNAAKHVVDVRRVRRAERVVRKAAKQDRAIPLLTAEARRATEAGTPTVAPLSESRTGYLAGRAQRMAVAKPKGRAIVRQKVEQQTVDRELYKRAAKVDPYAFKYATQYGIKDSKQAITVLHKHLARVKVEQQKLVDAGKVIPKKQNEIPHLERLLKDPSAFDHPMLQGAVRAGATAARKVAQESPGIADLQAIERRIAPQAKLLGVVRHDGEAQTDYLARAQQEIKARGLNPGEYYPSTKRVERQFLNRTTGGGSAMPESKRYQGALTSTGREHASLDAFANSLHQEIRRKHNWNLVNKVFESHTVPWSRDKKLGELQDLVDHHNIDPATITYVNVKKIQQAKRLGESSAQDVGDFAGADPEVQKALDEAFVDPAYVAKHPDEFRDTTMAIMPREVANELKSGFKQSSFLGRGYRVAKGGASRVLLSNPVWLQFQILSNALMAGTHRSGIVSAIKAHYKFKEPEWKALESDIGVHKFYDDRAHLGATANNNAFIDNWRAWQKVGAGSSARYAAHPVREFFNLFHRGDTAQNNFFRRAVLYNDVKREAYRRMAQDTGRMTAHQKRIMSTLKITDPQKLMDAIVKDPHQFEHHAQVVDDFMGNWTSYTSRERQLLGNAMFGGFIRFSTRLAFYTMPMRHPIMYSIALQMGRLEHDELTKIFGTEPPPWEIGNYYSEDGKAKFQAQRLNPFSNALTSLGVTGGNNLLGSLPPVLLMGIDQFAKENVAQKQPWFINGKQVDIRENVSTGSRVKMMAEAALKLSPFYRDVEKHGIPGVVKPLRGKQNSDSGILFPSPRTWQTKTKAGYKNTKGIQAIQRNEKLKDQQDKSSWTESVTPFGQSGSDSIQSAQNYAASQGKKKPPAKKPAAFDILSGPAGSHSLEILP